MTDSRPMKNPSGGVGARRQFMKPSLDAKLMEQVVERENVRRAWRQVKANRGAPGIDGQTIAETEIWLRTNWTILRESLLSGIYQPLPLRRKAIPKSSGGERLLGIPVVVDRLIQQAIAQVLGPIFDPGFSESSFGFRPRRSAHGALRQVQAFLRAGYRIAVDLDIEKFFDRVNHDVLMVRVARNVNDRRILALIGRYLRAGVVVGDIVQPTDEGTPQGGPLSPLLANILLDDLDKELERRGHRFARYADDLQVLVKSRRAGERVMASLKRYLADELRLTVNEAKSRVAPINECVFLGFTFRGTKLRWSDKAFDEFRYRLKRFTGRSWGISMEERLKRLAWYLRGWMGYFGISDYYRPVPELDHWLRRRVRLCYWKQWRWCKTRIRNLLALGTNRRHAILTGLSRKGYWRLSKTLATQTGMTNEWLAKQGLISIRDQWMKAHGYA
ncbi:MAG: group II intron reverse transcriptase/maturase [Candidatus Geothermincolia bacterium]